MTTSRIIEAAAAAAYARGVPALDVAQAVIEVLAEETLDLACGDPHAVLLARRIVGALLDAQWQMPTGTRAG